MKRKSIIIILLLSLFFALMPAVAFATETTEGEISTTAIEEYGYYKGKNAEKIPVITYHNFSEKKTGSTLYITKKEFDKQMKWLKKKGYRTINCEELYLWYKGDIKLPKKTVLITIDDGKSNVLKYALPVLKKYDLKATSFIIGGNTYKNKKGFIKYKKMLKTQEEYPNLEFQSHTYRLHKHFSSEGDYEIVLKDANKQQSIYGFDYLAYPYGRYTPGMIKAYKKAGIKLAFTYGSNGYATRKQNIYKIRRIKISGTGTFAQFKNWFK